MTDGRLAPVGMDYTYATVGAQSFRSPTTWTFGGYDEDAVAPVLLPPPDYSEN